MKVKKYYMHTIDGLPAFYDPEGQICYMNNHHSTACNYLCKSLAEIRKQQKLSKEWQRRNRVNISSAKYGYKIVREKAQ